MNDLNNTETNPEDLEESSLDETLDDDNLPADEPADILTGPEDENSLADNELEEEDIEPEEDAGDVDYDSFDDVDDM